LKYHLGTILHPALRSSSSKDPHFWHVNRLCLAAGVPLVEAGSTGYLGQVTVIRKGETECYECQPKAAQKVYPICTIRSTPDKPVHCVVWAKELYKLLFGAAKESMLFEDTAASDEPSTYMDKVGPPLDLDRAALVEYGRAAVVALFRAEIEKQLQMDRYKTATKTPAPLPLAAVEAADIDTDRPPAAGSAGGWDRSALWGQERAAVAEIIGTIVDRWSDPKSRENIGNFEFDKDDVVAMRFVTAASNLRALTFNIPVQSMYETKGIAGNIIPAIATTNAIIAGLQVMEAIKAVTAVAEGESIATRCKFTYCLRSRTRKGLTLQPTRLQPPAPGCFVCSTAQLELHIDTARATLRHLIDAVLKRRLGINEPSISIGYSTVYEEGEGADDSLRVNLDKTLRALPAGGVAGDGGCLSVEDFSQDLEVTLAVLHRDDFDEEENPEGFELKGSSPSAPKPNGTSSAPQKGMASHQNADKIENGGSSATSGNTDGKKAEGGEDEDDCCIVIDAERMKRKKRKLDEESGAASTLPPSKKRGEEGEEDGTAKTNQSFSAEQQVSKNDDVIEIL